MNEWAHRASSGADEAMLPGCRTSARRRGELGEDELAPGCRRRRSSPAWAHMHSDSDAMTTPPLSSVLRPLHWGKCCQLPKHGALHSRSERVWFWLETWGASRIGGVPGSSTCGSRGAGGSGICPKFGLCCFVFLAPLPHHHQTVGRWDGIDGGTPGKLFCSFCEMWHGALPTSDLSLRSSLHPLVQGEGVYWHGLRVTSHGIGRPSTNSVLRLFCWRHSPFSSKLECWSGSLQR